MGWSSLLSLHLPLYTLQEDKQIANQTSGIEESAACSVQVKVLNRVARLFNIQLPFLLQDLGNFKQQYYRPGQT